MKKLKWITLLFAVACVLPFIHGCGGGANDPSSVALKPSNDSGDNGNGGGNGTDNGTDNGTGGNGAGGYGTFKGRVIITGTEPTFALLVRKGAATVKDPGVCAASDIPDEKLVIGEDRGVKNVFIFLRRAPAGGKVSAAHEPTGQQLFNQKQCTFIPHAMVLRVGIPVLVKSGDSVPHNVKTNPNKNDPFNATLDATNVAGVELTYARSEQDPVRVECNFHNWMRAYHLPLDHPYGVVTKADGSFEINDLPVGEKLSFVIWHELAGRIESRYSVEIKSDGDVVERTIEIDAGRFTAFKGPAPKSVKLSQLR